MFKTSLQIFLGAALSFTLTGCYVDHSGRGHGDHDKVVYVQPVRHDAVYVQPEHHDDASIDVHVH